MSSNDDDNCGGSAREDRMRRERVAQKHARAAADGLHLPSVKELLLGSSPWLSKNILADAKLWAERILPRIDQSNEPGRIVCEKIAALIDAPAATDFWVAAAAARRASDPENFVTIEDFSDVASEFIFRGPDIIGIINRLDMYAAAAGSSDACVRIAQLALIFANDSGVAVDEAAKMAEAALGWLAVARDVRPVQLTGRGARYELSEGPRKNARALGNILVGEILRANELLGEDLSAQADGKSARGLRRRGRGTLAAARTLDVEFDRDEIEESATEAKRGVVVIHEIGNPDTHEGKRVAEAFKKVTGVHLPLPPVPDLVAVRRTLVAEFPHAVQVVDALLREISGRDHVRLQPTLFIGEPGSGKTTCATRLLNLLGVATMVYPCGGVADSSYAGTARQWSSGTPSTPVSQIMRHRTAAPGIVLDEIQRVGTSRHNGNLLDALLAMMEPVSACRWYDPYLQSEVDLSGAIWLATANTLEDVPAALRDRMRILRFPSPGPEHLDALAPAILRKAVAERGLPEAWAWPLDGIEKDALRRAWQKGGSIRSLRRLIEGVLAARDEGMARA